MNDDTLYQPNEIDAATEASNKLDATLSYRPPLREPLAFVNAVLLALPATANTTPQPTWRSRAFAIALATFGLVLMLLPDTYLLGLAGAWLDDAGGAVSNAGQSLGNFVSNPSISSSDFASELFSHPSVLLGLCLLAAALFALLYQSLTAPLPALPHGEKVATR